MFLIFFRNILCPQQMFPSLRAQGNVVSNNVSSFATALSFYRTKPDGNTRVAPKMQSRTTLSSVLFTAPLISMRTLKFKAQPTNVFFPIVNLALFRCLNSTVLTI